MLACSWWLGMVRLESVKRKKSHAKHVMSTNALRWVTAGHGKSVWADHPEQKRTEQTGDVVGMVTSSKIVEGYASFYNVFGFCHKGDGKSMVNLRERRDIISYFNMIDFLIVLWEDCEIMM